VTTTKLVFASPEWLARLGEILCSLVEAHPTEAVAAEGWSVSETYLHVPHQGGATQGFHFRIANGRLDFHPYPDETCTLSVVAEYETMLLLATAMTADQTAVADAMASGKLAITGDGTMRPAFLKPGHDLIAAETMPPTEMG
jgi:hypothetical protein